MNSTTDVIPQKANPVLVIYRSKVRGQSEIVSGLETDQGYRKKRKNKYDRTHIFCPGWSENEWKILRLIHAPPMQSQQKMAILRLNFHEFRGSWGVFPRLQKNAS